MRCIAIAFLTGLLLTGCSVSARSRSCLGSHGRECGGGSCGQQCQCGCQQQWSSQSACNSQCPPTRQCAPANCQSAPCGANQQPAAACGSRQCASNQYRSNQCGSNQGATNQCGVSGSVPTPAVPATHSGSDDQQSYDRTVEGGAPPAPVPDAPLPKEPLRPVKQKLPMKFPIAPAPSSEIPVEDAGWHATPKLHLLPASAIKQTRHQHSSDDGKTCNCCGQRI